MASRNFTINTSPHTAIIGDVTLLFQPEVTGASFAEAYLPLRDVQAKAAAAGENITAAELAEVDTALREFVERFLLPDSLDAFDAMVLPTRVLVQLLEYAAELYGGGVRGNVGTGSSSAS